MYKFLECFHYICFPSYFHDKPNKRIWNSFHPLFFLLPFEIWRASRFQLGKILNFWWLPFIWDLDGLGFRGSQIYGMCVFFRGKLRNMVVTKSQRYYVHADASSGMGSLVLWCVYVWCWYCKLLSELYSSFFFLLDSCGTPRANCAGYTKCMIVSVASILFCSKLVITWRCLW